MLTERSQFYLRILPDSIFTLQVSAEIIVGRSTPEVGRKRLTFLNHIQTVHFVFGQITGMPVELHAESLTGDNKIVAVILLYHGSSHFHVAQFRVLQIHCRSLIGIQRQLVFSNNMPCRKQTFTFLQFIRHVKQPLGTLADSSQIQFDFSSLLRSYIQVIHTTAAHHLAVFQHFPLQITARKVTEEVFVEYINFSTLQIGRSCPDILIDTSYLVHMRIGYAVGTDKTIVTEIDIAGIKAVEVTAIGINHLTVLTGPTNGLVYKIPNETTLIFGIFANHIPIFFETAFRITHGMRILTLNERSVHRIILTIFQTIVISIIHRTEYIGLSCLSGLFVLHGTARVFRFHPVISRFKVRPITGFITQ